MKGITIKPNKSGKVRTSLCSEDIDIDRLDIMEEFGFIQMEWFKNEPFLIFKEPLAVPKFNKFYASRIKSASDPYLEEVIRALVYLNPSPDLLTRKKLVEFILLRFSAMVMKPSEVSMDRLVPVPVLKFEEVSGALNMYLLFKNGAYTPTTGVYVLFSNTSMFTPSMKKEVHAMARMTKIYEHMSSAIHIVVEHLMDEFEQVKITTSKIETTKLVVTKKGSASIRSITKYMSEATKKNISDHNIGAAFKSYRTYEKYAKFLELQEINDSLGRTAATLGVSKSTIMEFKKVQNGSY
jgi:hypothetical protein